MKCLHQKKHERNSCIGDQCSLKLNLNFRFLGDTSFQLSCNPYDTSGGESSSFNFSFIKKNWLYCCYYYNDYGGYFNSIQNSLLPRKYNKYIQYTTYQQFIFKAMGTGHLLVYVSHNYMHTTTSKKTFCFDIPFLRKKRPATDVLRQTVID